MTSVTLCDMAHGYSGGNGDWPPPPRREPRDSSTPGGGRRRAPEPPPDSFNGFANPSRPEPPGSRNGMLAGPRGVGQPPPPGAGLRRAPAPTPASPPPPPPGNRNTARAYGNRVVQAPPVSPAPRPMPGRPIPPPPGRRPPQAVVPGPPRPRPTGRRWQRIHINPHLSKRWRAGLGVLGVFLVLAVCGISSYMIVLDEQRGVQAQANSTGPKPTATPVDISSRKVDSIPLTAAEVFPNPQILIDPKQPDLAYTMIGSPQELSNCNSATDGEIKTLIDGLGCNQVIRATFAAPSNVPGYVVTGGIMNLDTAEGAEKAYEQIRPIIRDKKGRFVGYVINSDKTNTKNLALASTAVGWVIKGHYLAFCVIARKDGTAVDEKDNYASTIMFDMVEFYLKGVVLEARAFDPITDGTPAPSVKPSS